MKRIENMNLQEVNNKIAALKATMRMGHSEMEYGMPAGDVSILLEMAEARREELLNGMA